MKRIIKVLGAIALLSLLLVPAGVTALTVPARPVGRANDLAGMFSAAALQQLNGLLGGYEARSGNQIIIAAFPSIEGGNLNKFAADLYAKWKIGPENRQSGVLIVIFKKERLIKIEVGPALREVLTPERCNAVILQTIIPNFKKDDYNSGIVETAQVLINILDEGSAKTVTPAKSLSHRAMRLLVLLLLLAGALAVALIRMKLASGYLLDSTGLKQAQVNEALPGGSGQGSSGGWYSEAKKHSSLPGCFFDDREIAEISENIRQAEDIADLSIKIFLERTIAVPVLERAQMILADLVAGEPGGKSIFLVYLVTKDKLLAMTGNESARLSLSPTQWDKLRDTLQENFDRSAFAAGLKEVITNIGNHKEGA